MPTIRVGVPTAVELRSQLDLDAWDATRGVLASLAHVELLDVDASPWIDAGLLLYGGPWVAERYAAVGAFVETAPPDVDPVVAAIITGARDHSAREAYEAQYRLAALARAAAQRFADVDLIVLPTTSGVATLAEVAADPVGRNAELGRFTNGVNLLDHAAVAVPGIDRADGWPFGLSLIGPAWSDDLLVDLAQRFLEEGDVVGDVGGPFASAGGVDVVVVGAHLTGQPLNGQLLEHGARFVRSSATTPSYRLFAMNTVPPKPALVHTGDANGSSIEVEVWRMPTAEVGTFSQRIPAPLGLGRVELRDGSAPTGFIAEPRAMVDAVDITSFGGWRAYLASR
jgi:allophanate hydrolase